MKEFPAGTILIWENVAIPTGWQVLSAAIGRFIMGASEDAGVGAAGGADTHSHANTGIYTDYSGTHSHTGTGDAGSAGAGTSVLNGSGATATTSHTHSGSSTLGAANNHRHLLDQSVAADNNPKNIRRVLIEKL